MRRPFRVFRIISAGFRNTEKEAEKATCDKRPGSRHRTYANYGGKVQWCGQGVYDDRGQTRDSHDDTDQCQLL